MPLAVSGASDASSLTGPRGAGLLSRLALVALALAFAATLLAIAPPPQASASTGSQANKIVATAKTHLGKKWVLGATGLKTFDCSGLVFRVYKQNGLLDKVGGKRRTAKGFYNWFRQRGLASKKNPKVGDLIVWGNATHIGIYVGGGMAISALTTGVKRHGVHRVTIPFRAYLHVNIKR